MKQLHIIGGGPAGLGIAVAAKERGLPFTLYEASDQPGGNARTLSIAECLYDTGAHRFHDKNLEITTFIKSLLGDDLLSVSSPSVIYHKGRFIDFPLHLGSLIRSLTPKELAQIVASIAISRFRFHQRSERTSFKEVTTARYGKALANLFLLNYSEKLWGVRTEQLSVEVSGGRLRGLTLRGLLKETFGREKSVREHLDGSFYYPRKGIGTISERLSEFAGSERIKRNSRITRILRRGNQVTGIEVNGDDVFETERLISTLPISRLLQLLDPKPPDEILATSSLLGFRHLLLVPIVIKRPYLTPNASVYFPDSSIPFTRLYESKNRSHEMAPSDRTCVVLELPSHPNSSEWASANDHIAELGLELINRVFGVQSEEVIAYKVDRIPFAYPILDLEYATHVEKLLAYLSQFSNLTLAGRNGLFQYVHIHDLLAAGKKLIENIASDQ
ncbi:MAG: NAD(P)/FAD-dependent oxidoreductase [Candidatus Kapaibacterium sp.]